MTESMLKATTVSVSRCAGIAVAPGGRYSSNPLRRQQGSFEHMNESKT
jgi:hypothetical protein